jgi:hypothetical protein
MLREIWGDACSEPSVTTWLARFALLSLWTTAVLVITFIVLKVMGL